MGDAKAAFGNESGLIIASAEMSVKTQRSSFNNSLERPLNCAVGALPQSPCKGRPAVAPARPGLVDRGAAWRLTDASSLLTGHCAAIPWPRLLLPQYALILGVPAAP